MSYLVDTNVMLRSIQNSHPLHADAAHSIKSLLRQGEELSITPQNLIEFWAVATRPQLNNGLDLSIHETAQLLVAFRTDFRLLTDNNDIFKKWEELVQQHRVLGKQVYDARLVAAMIVHDVSHLLTFNTDDFKRFTTIVAVNPQSISNQ
jgi:predicted nucleic acid-binding protein